MDLKGMVVSAILISVFLFATMTFAINFASKNDVSSPLLDDESINRTYTNVEEELDAVSGTAESQRENIYEDIEDEDSDEIKITSILGVGKALMTVAKNTFDISFGLIAKTFGIPFITGVAGAIVVFVLLLLFWRVIKTGG